MGLNRRQFLWSLAAISGVGTAWLGRPWKSAEPATETGSSQTAVASPEPHPASQPSPRDRWTTQRGDVRIVVISDLNSQYGSTDYEPEVDRAIALIPEFQPDLVLCGGDMVAGQKTSLTTANIQAMWAAFDQHVAAPLRQMGLPFGFTIGNHDGSGAIAGGTLPYQRERDLAAAYWNDPRHNPGLNFVDRAGFPFYYTFQLQDIFFLVWDASTAQIPAAQLAWVERSLASPTAQAAKLRLAIGHLPLYGIAVNRDRPGEYLAQAEALRSLLERYDVHTYISGHNHVYYPGHRGQLELLYAGALGGGPRQLLGSDRPAQKSLTVVDLDLETATTTYTTLDPKTLTLIDQRQLPRLIASSTGAVVRRDLGWNDLTAAERAIAPPL